MDHSIGVALIIFLLIAAGWWFVRKYNPKHARPQGRVRTAGATFHWPPPGGYDVEAVGEAKRQRELRRLAGDHGERSAEALHVAELRPEDSNRFDGNAVMVLVNGQHVGYLAREDSPVFRQRLAARGLEGSTLCNAMVVGGGTRRDGEKLFYGIRLDIEPFEEW